MSDIVARAPDQADTVEATSRAMEIKFIVDTAGAAAVIAWARTRLERDPHGAGADGDEYTTTSLYFDTDDRDVLCRRGSYGVAKYRMRRYGTGDAVFVERKLRSGAAVTKRRTRLTLGELQRIEHLELVDRAEARWFHRRVIARRLRPACTVEYVRTARVADTDAGPIRLTIDRELRAARAMPVGIEPSAAQPVLTGRCVLELKFPGTLPLLFKELVATFALEPAPCSKYRFSMQALGLAATLPEAAPATRAPHRLRLGSMMLEV